MNAGEIAILLVHWTLIVTGALYIITRSLIFGVFRFQIGRVLAPRPLLRGWVRELIYCPACMGFWVGLAAVWIWPFDGNGALMGSAIAGVALGSILPSIWPHTDAYTIEGSFWGVEESDGSSEQEEESDGSAEE